MLALVLLAAPALLTNARLETRAVSGPLAAEVRRAARGPEPVWVAWVEPHRGAGSACCMDIGRVRRLRGGGCRLESSQTFNVTEGGTAAELDVLLRVVSGRVERVRAFTDDCVLDAEGRPVVWLEGVAPAESVKLLKELLADPARPEHVADEALTAMALHAAPEAVTALLDLAKHASADVRGNALFWLAQRAADEARAAITRAIEEDPETEVKRRAVFALSEMADGKGVPLLIDLARRHKNPAVREQAFFWLGESEDPRALAFFEEVLGR